MWENAVEILTWAGGLTAGALLLVLIVFGLLLWKARRTLNTMIFGGTDALEGKLAGLRKKWPDLSEEELLRKLVNGEAFIAGLIGFFTGLGGMVTLPITLPLDILATMKIQSRLIAFIDEKSGAGQATGSSAGGSDLQNYAILAGAKQLNHLGAKLLLKVIMRYAPRIVLQALPLVGGLVGFLMDWLITRGIGTVALSKNRPALATA